MKSQFEEEDDSKMELENNQFGLVNPLDFDRNKFYWGLCHKGNLSFDEAIHQFEIEQYVENKWIDDQILSKTQKLKNLRSQYQQFQENNQIDISQDLENIENSITNISNELIQTKKWQLGSDKPYALRDIESLNQLIQNKTQLRVQRQLLQFKDTGEENNYIQYYLKFNSLTKKQSQENKNYQKAQVLYKINKLSASTFNKDATILLAVSNEQINIWEVQNDQLKFVTQLQTQGRYLIGASFSQIQNIFITYDLQGTFGIVTKENGFWTVQQLVQAHTEIIRYIKFLNNDSEIISVGSEGSIKIWKKDNNQQWICSQQFSTRGQGLYSFDMYNEKAITTGDIYGNLIFWCFNKEEQNSQKYKFIKQQRIIKAHKNVINSISFINQNEVASMSHEKEINIWFQNEENKIFNLKQLIDLTDVCPLNIFIQVIRFIPNFQILVCNTGNQITFYKKNKKDGRFEEIQKISKSTEQHAFSVSNDGQYLVYSDPQKQKLILRKYN